MKKFILMFMCVIFMSSLFGCETVKGMGRDMENTGDNIQEAVGATTN